MNRNRDAKVTVFTVWEPILFTDWRKPGSRVLHRLTDSRVGQFWDKNHLTAKQLAKDARKPQPEPDCCTRDGILWDLVAVYPPHALWTETVPPALLFNGDVESMEANLEAAVRKLQK